MKALLLQDVGGLGRAGEIKEVAEGHFRNYLAPRGLAAPATEATLKRVAQQKEVTARREARAASANRSLADRISQTQVTFRVKVGEQHRLYGAVTAADVAERLRQVLGHEIDKHHVELEEPIRHLGTYEVPVHLAKGVEPKVKVVVEREEESV